MRTGCGMSLSSLFWWLDLLKLTGNNHTLFVYSTTHSKLKRASGLHLNNWSELFLQIHNKIPCGFTIDTQWWTVMMRALFLRLHGSMEEEKERKRTFCQVRGKPYWSICIVSLILLEVCIPHDQYLATASLFFCVTYYCRWNKRPAPQLELWGSQG